MSVPGPWQRLGIEATGDAATIRKAYAKRIRAMDLDADAEGYAALRQARDTALQLARTIAAEMPAAPAEEADNPAPAEPDTAALAAAGARWTYAAPQLPGDWERDAGLSVPAEPSPGDAMPPRTAPDFGGHGLSGTEIPLSAADPFAPLHLGGCDEAATLGVSPGETPCIRLAALLTPQGQFEGEPMSDAEIEKACGCLRAVIDDVHTSSIARQDEIETWLADLLVKSWPRCAPLLETATAAFGWQREWGKIDARPAVEHLGARLRGYRFQQAVRDPAHRHHRAWTELSRSGPAGPFRFLRTHPGDVASLLARIRKHFPELEWHFDPDRVASWESGFRWPRGTITFACLLILALAHVLLTLPGPAPQASSPGRSAAPLTGQAPATAIDRPVAAAIADSFGKDKDIAWLRQHQPGLAQVLTANARHALDKGEDQQAVVRKAADIVRERVYRDGRLLTGDDFETTMHLRLGQLRAAQATGAAACERLMHASWLDSAVPVPAALRDRERRFAAALAERGLLKAPDRFEGSSARIPPELIARVMRETRLDREQVAAALQGQGSAARQCAVIIALLDATLAWNGPGRKAILLTL